MVGTGFILNSLKLIKFTSNIILNHTGPSSPTIAIRIIPIPFFSRESMSNISQSTCIHKEIVKFNNKWENIKTVHGNVLENKIILCKKMGHFKDNAKYLGLRWLHGCPQRSERMNKQTYSPPSFEPMLFPGPSHLPKITLKKIRYWYLFSKQTTLFWCGVKIDSNSKDHLIRTVWNTKFIHMQTDGVKTMIPCCTKATGHCIIFWNCKQNYDRVSISSISNINKKLEPYKVLKEHTIIQAIILTLFVTFKS